jgi:copper chaperone
MQTTIRIQGMSCGHCVRAVDAALRKLPGVQVVRVAVGEAVVETSGPPNLDQIRHAIEAEGYQVV